MRKVLVACVLFVTVGRVANAANVTVSWDADTVRADGSALNNLSGYRVFQSTHSLLSATTTQAFGDSSVTKTSVSASTTSLYVTGLNAGTTYYFRLTAFDSNALESAFNVDYSSMDVEVSTYYPTFSSIDTSSPTTPTNPAAVVISSTQINLSWTASTDDIGVVGYKIYRGGVQFSTTTGVAFQNTGLTPATTYNYQIAAYDAAGNSSPRTSTVTAVTTPANFVDTSSPTVPTNLAAVKVSSTQINLSWTASTDNVGVTGYRIYRGGVQFSTTTGVAYQNTGLTPATTYTYTVAAYDAAGNASNQSSSAQAVTDPPPFVDSTPPSAAVIQSVTALSASQLRVIWSASSDNVAVAGYNVLRGGVVIATTTSLSYNDSGLQAATTYTYTIRAFDAVGNASTSSSQSGVTSPATVAGRAPDADAYSYPNPAVGVDPMIRVMPASSGPMDSISVTVFDSSGIHVWSTNVTGGPNGTLNGKSYYDIRWSGSKASGMYYAVIHAKAGGQEYKSRVKIAVIH